MGRFNCYVISPLIDDENRTVFVIYEINGALGDPDSMWRVARVAQDDGVGKWSVTLCAGIDLVDAFDHSRIVKHYPTPQQAIAVAFEALPIKGPYGGPV